MTEIGREKGELERERGRTLRESANDGGSSGGVILEDLFDGAGSGSHLHERKGQLRSKGKVLEGATWVQGRDHGKGS